MFFFSFFFFFGYLVEKKKGHTYYIDKQPRRLINIFHCRVILDVTDGLLGGLFIFLVIVNVQAHANNAVDACAEGGGVIKRKVGREERRVKEEEDKVLDVNVVLVGIGLILEGLHDTLHVGSPAKLARHQHAGRVHHAVGHDDLLDLVAKNVLDDGTQVLERRLVLFKLLLLILVIINLQAFLGARDHLLAVVFLDGLHSVLIDGIHQVQHLIALLDQLLNKGRCLHHLLGLAGDVVDALLVLLHACHIVLERCCVITRLGGWIAEELTDLGAVLRVLVHTKLDLLLELVVELFVQFGILSNFVEHFKALFDNVFADDLENTRVLQHFTGNVEGKILRVDDTLDEVEIVGNEVGAVVHDKHATHVELDVAVFLGLALERVHGRALGHVEHGAELEVTLHREVLHGKVLFPVVAEALVKLGILLMGNVISIPEPERLGLVQDLVFGVFLL